MPPGLFSVCLNPCPVIRRQRRSRGRGQRVTVTNPVGHHHSVRIRFHALRNPLDKSPVDFSRGVNVRKCRRTQTVSFHNPHPQIIRNIGCPFVLEHRQCVAVHKKSCKRQLLQHIEVVDSVSVTGRFVRPQRKFAHNLRVHFLRFLVGNAQELVINLRCRRKPTANYVGSHRFDGSRCKRNAHVSVAASFPQDSEIIFDVPFRVASVPHPAPH